MRVSKRREKSHPEFFSDTADQIVRSVDNLPGVRDNLEQAFQEATTRVRKHPKRKSKPPTNEPKEGDSL